MLVPVSVLTPPELLTNVNILGAAPVERTAPDDKDTVLPPVWLVALDCVPPTIVPFN